MEKLKNGTVSKIGGTPYWIVDKSFIWYLDYEDKNGWCVIASHGFKTDMGSIPRLLWMFFDKTKYNGYCIHDVLYNTQMKYHIGRREFELISRSEADMILLECIAYEGAGFIERFCIYFGVRLFGWIPWIFKN